MKKLKLIKWKTRPVLVSSIKPTPNNFKLHTEDGAARFKTSVDLYGLAGAVILNTDLTLIDGNTRIKKAKELGEKYIDASLPDRKLTLKEFTEFAAMFDLARAGEVDVLRIKEELGDTKSFFKKWGFDMPGAALNKLAELEKNDSVINPTVAKHIPDIAKEVAMKPVALIFTPEQNREYLGIAEALYKRFNVDNVTDLNLKAFRYLKKLNKQNKIKL